MMKLSYLDALISSLDMFSLAGMNFFDGLRGGMSLVSS